MADGGIDTKWLRQVCAELPGTVEDIKWGGDLCFCVGEKMYAVTQAGKERSRVTFKTTPEDFTYLIQHESIIPAPYMARYYWIRVFDHSLLDEPALADMLRRSYEMVVSKFTKKKQRELRGE